MRPWILSFDTSGPHCAVAVFAGPTCLAERQDAMARGQAEALMPMVTDCLGQAGLDAQSLDAIATGIGPGNFTGLRIAVAAARGLALGLNVPAIGVTGFEMIAAVAALGPGVSALALPAPRGQAYVQLWRDGRPKDAPQLVGPDRPVAALPAPNQLLGPGAARIAPLWPLAECATADISRPAPIIARIAAERLAAGAPIPRPAPLYARAPDAAPPREAPLLIIE